MFYPNARAIIERIINGKIEVVIQMRYEENKPGLYEFPGGKIEHCESFFDALRREVKEETGLEIIKIAGEENVIRCENPYFGIECFRPYAVYQTVNGKKDSLGAYFICAAVGELLIEGDHSKDIKWINLDQFQSMLDTEGLFSGMDRAAALLYLKEYNSCIV